MGGAGGTGAKLKHAGAALERRAPLMLGVLDQLAKGSAIETPQDESRATLAPKLSREASKIDWTRPAADIANQIRGMYPWPGCRVRLIDAAGNETARVTLVRLREGQKK